MTPFETAFAAARKQGLSEFTFNGKRYNTRRADNKPLPLRQAISNAVDSQPNLAVGSGRGAMSPQQIAATPPASQMPGDPNPEGTGMGAFLASKPGIALGDALGALIPTKEDILRKGEELKGENAAATEGMEPSRMSQIIRMLRGK